MTDEEWEAYVGTPPDWLYMLIGRVSVEAVRVDFHLVATALQMVNCTPPNQHEILDVLTSGSAIRKVITQAIDTNTERSAALRAAHVQARTLAAQRNSYVHGVVEWGDVEFQYVDPSTGRWEWTMGEGWYQQDPKPHRHTTSGRPLCPPIPLGGKLKARMEQTLAELQALSQCLVELSNR